MKLKITLLILAATAFAATAAAYPFGASFVGQGLSADGFGGYDLNTETCGIANGAEVDGPYLLWVLTATRSDNADITGPWGTAAMVKFGNGTFKYVSPWYAPDALLGNVSGTYDGKAKNAQLVLSHGCRPLNPNKPAWCSPGFWKNAEQVPTTGPRGQQYPGAWPILAPFTSPSEMFNGNVSTFYYGETLATDASLLTVLKNPQTYSKDPVAGGLSCALNAYNAAGAFLTDRIPGYRFDCAAMSQDESDTCPIDSHGNFKTPQE